MGPAPESDLAGGPAMMSVALGPLALPVGPVLLIASFAAGNLLARRLAGPNQAVAASAVAWQSLGIGLAAARLAYVLANASAYGATPWDLLDLRDGGWQPGAGIAAGAAWAALQAGRRPALRRALAGGAMAWIGTAVALGALLGVTDTPQLTALQFIDLKTGQPTDLDATRRGRPAVVNLWASWCGPCRAEMPVLADAQRRQQAVAIVFVNAGESAETVQRYLQRERLVLDAVLLDADSRLSRAAGSRGLPSTLFVDARGQAVGAHFGVLSAAALQARIDSLGPTPGP